MARGYNHESLDDFYAAIGYGAIGTQQVVMRLGVVDDQESVLPTIAPQQPARTGGVRVKGVGDLLVRFGRCCHPIPGDPITGFVTRGKGVTVHLRTCPTGLQREPDRGGLGLSFGPRGTRITPRRGDLPWNRQSIHARPRRRHPRGVLRLHAARQGDLPGADGQPAGCGRSRAGIVLVMPGALFRDIGGSVRVWRGTLRVHITDQDGRPFNEFVAELRAMFGS